MGDPVRVSVNPRDPADAVLVAGPDWEGLLPLGFGLLLLLFGIGERKAPTTPVPALTGPPEPRYRTAKVLAAIGAAVCLYGCRDLYIGWSSLGWPVADGCVLHSQARTGGTNETQFWYEYYVAKTRYVAGKYRTGGNSTPFQDVAVAAARRYPAGQAVKVYYNPSDPSQALLEPGVWYDNFVLPRIGAVILAAAWVAKMLAEAMARPR